VLQLVLPLHECAEPLHSVADSTAAESVAKPLHSIADFAAAESVAEPLQYVADFAGGGGAPTKTS
jgi:hypothetical protein